MDCIFCKIANGEIPSTKVYDFATSTRRRRCTF